MLAVLVLGFSLSALSLGVLAAAARSAAGVYVVNDGSSDVSQYAIGDAGFLSPLIPATVPAGSAPASIALTPDGRSAYVTNQVSHTVSQYDVDRVTGALSPKMPAVLSTGLTAPTGIAVAPDSRSAYIASVGPNGNAGGSVSQYNIDRTTGALLPKNSAAVSTGLVPIQVTVAPDGRSAYVTNEDGGTVSQYKIDPANGALFSTTPANVAAAVFPYAIAVAPDSMSAYVTEEGTQGGDHVLQYSINPVTGALSPKSSVGVATGPFPEGIAISPDGRSVYVTSIVANTVSQYNVEPRTGALSPKTPAAVATGPIPVGVAVTPNGRSVYVVNSGSGPFGIASSVSEFNIERRTGRLSPKNPGSVLAGSASFAIAIESRDRRGRVG